MDAFTANRRTSVESALTQGMAVATFPATPEAAARARLFIQAYFVSRNLPELAERGALAASEVFTNAVRWGKPVQMDESLELSIIVAIIEEATAFRISTFDSGRDTPPDVAPSAGEYDENHRGLAIVDAISDGRGCDRLPAGIKSVWFLLDKPSRAPSRRRDGRWSGA